MCTFCIIYAQENKALLSTDDANRLSDDFVAYLDQSQVGDALTLMEKQFVPSSTEKFETVADGFTAFLEKSGKEYGKFVGSNFAKKESIGDFLIRFTYAIKYERHPVWIRLTYYQAYDKFLLKKIEWGEDVVELF